MLVASDMKVDARVAMSAAGRLQSLLDTRSGQPDIVDIMVKQQNHRGGSLDGAGVAVAGARAAADGIVDTDDRNDHQIEDFDPGDDGSTH